MTKQDIAKMIETMDYGKAPEANTSVLQWLKQHADQPLGHYIGGKFQLFDDEATLTVINPATGAEISSIPKASASTVDRAVRAARKAQPGWAGLPAFERANYLYALARNIQKHARFLAVLESMNNGKPIRESRDIDIPLVVRHFYHHAGWTMLLESEFADLEPLGVCGQIIPWNFPLLMLAWKIAPALAAGNCVILKPAEYTPLTAHAFAEICVEIGLPEGVVNIIHGDGETGADLVRHSGIDKIAFTGSTEVGRRIRQETAGSGKKLTLELGGKSPFIVCDDADLDSAVEGVVDAIWFNQGEVCCAGSRLLLQESIADSFEQKLKARLNRLRIGDPLDKSTDLGAIVHPKQLERIKNLVQQGIQNGGILHQTSSPLPKQGCFFAPGYFTNVSSGSGIMQEEIFGPIVGLMRFRTPDEAIALANNSRYGLSASIWSENINLALSLAAQVKAGVVWINATNMFDAAAGFGGYRESGFGREGGREGMYAYLRDAEDRSKTTAPDDRFTPKGIAGKKRAATAHKAVIDETAKLYIGGKQVRPDSGYSYQVEDHKGRLYGLVGLGNRKDIRNAVEAASKATGWSNSNGHHRAQILYFLAENLGRRKQEFAQKLMTLCGMDEATANAEVHAGLARIFYYAALADKYDGNVHETLSRHVTLAMREPYGIIGIICPEVSPLLGFLSLLLPAVAMGNRVVILPSQHCPILVTDFYQILETSDMPAGVVNIITGSHNDLVQTLAEHDEVAAIWAFTDSDTGQQVESCSAGNLKVTWVNNESSDDWYRSTESQGDKFLRHACQIKNIWIPYGE